MKRILGGILALSLPGCALCPVVGQDGKGEESLF
jgi:hypothetical protein